MVPAKFRDGMYLARMMRPYMPLFRASTTLKELILLHAHLIVTGLQKDSLASTKLIESYSEMGSIQTSRLIFESFPNPDSFMWGVLIKCHVWNGLFREAISMYQSMLQSLTSEVNRFIFPSVLRACSEINDLEAGKKVHSRILKSGFESDPIVETSLMSMYGEMRCLYHARKMFDEMSVRDVVSWSSIISIYVQNEQASEGLEMLREMVMAGVEIDPVTMLTVVEACGELGLLEVGKSAHGYVIRQNIGTSYEALTSSLVAMYGKLGDVCSANRLFIDSLHQSVTLWTAMISCYNQNYYYSEALWTFSKMLDHKMEPNSITLMNVVRSCARLKWLSVGKCIHAYALKNNINLDENYLRSSLIDLYADCGKLRYSRHIFDNTQEKPIVSWNILISGYTREGEVENAISLFVQMLVQGISPDSYTLSSALSACGMICLSELGCQTHSLIIKTFLPNEFVHNSLIDMYSKCGFINSAFKIFHEIQERSVVTWNSMICGFSHNGFSKEALTLFDEMHARNLDMDEVTLLSAIQACSNLGLIDKGKWIHHKLITFGVCKDVYIDTALTNMYARCGDLQIARRVFDHMNEWSVVSWSAMIGGYAMHGRIDDSISLFDKMVELGVKPNDVSFMNILSACSHAGYIEKGKFYFNLMVKDFGIMPNSEHYSCLVDMLSRAGDLNGAYAVINSMSFPVHASVWGALVNGCRIHQRMDFLESIKRDFVNMHSEDSGYYTLLSNVYAEEGKWDEFVTVKSKMKSVGVKKVHGYSMVET